MFLRGGGGWYLNAHYDNSSGIIEKLATDKGYFWKGKNSVQRRKPQPKSSIVVPWSNSEGAKDAFTSTKGFQWIPGPRQLVLPKDLASWQFSFHIFDLYVCFIKSLVLLLFL